MLGCEGRKGRCEKRFKRRCRKVCWGVWEVRGDVGKGEVRKMWGSVLGPHTLDQCFSTAGSRPGTGPCLLFCRSAK